MPLTRGMAQQELQGSGVLPLRLWLDLQMFDPALGSKNAHTLSPVEHFRIKNISKSDHIHNFIYTHGNMTKPDKNIPGGEVTFDEKSEQLVSVCSICRLSVIVELGKKTMGSYMNTTCQPQSSNSPCHHFVFNPNNAATRVVTDQQIRENPTEWVDKRHYTCSEEFCPRTLAIEIRPPLITEEIITFLSDKERLKEAARKGHEVNPEKIPANTIPSTYPDVLRTLKSYLVNLLSPQPRNIPTANARYVVTLGEGSIPILEKFGYKAYKVGETTELRKKPWSTDNESTRRLNIVLTELDLLHADSLRGEPEVEQIQLTIRSSEDHIRRLLGCDLKTYGQHFLNMPGTAIRPLDLAGGAGSLEKPLDLTQDIEPVWYRGLGACQVHVDYMVQFAFDRQTKRDHPNRPLYYECFKKIAELRESESLMIEVAKLESQGEITDTQLGEAYATLNVDRSADEGYIIVMFRSIIDTAGDRADDLREAARIIGKYRNNPKIAELGEKPVRDLAHAYFILNANETTDDDWIISNYTVRTIDAGDSDTTPEKEALKMIAEARNSEMLLTKYREEFGLIPQEPPPMSLEEAYAVLGASADTGDDLLLAAYELNGKDKVRWKNAVQKIGEARQSHTLLQAVYENDGKNASNPTRQQNWPVGLENIGNTCYLNSLLQYYYSIKPLREMVLNFDNYQEGEVTEALLEVKRVGGRKVTAHEIERAKRFASELRRLFELLGSSDQASITPERDLAYLALVSPKDENQTQRTSTPVPDAMPALEPLLSDTMEIDSVESTVRDASSIHSEATLVGEEPPKRPTPEDFTMINASQITEDQEDEVKEIHLDDKSETLDSDTKTDGAIPPAVLEKAPVAPMTNSNAFNEENIPLLLKDDDIIEVDSDFASFGTSPRKPPPIPPRPPKSYNMNFDNNFMFGRQQDVTECIENVMFQLEAAMRGEAVDESGEQQDLIKKLFYGKTTQYLEKDGEDTSKKTEYFSHLIINVAEGNKDIYTALDGLFDAEKVELDGKDARRYQTISLLPPILQIQVQRVQFNRNTGTAYKSTSQLSFPETIYLDRYCEAPADSTLNARRREAWKWKAELAELDKRIEELDVSLEGDGTDANVSPRCEDGESPRKRLKLSPVKKKADLADTFMLGASFAEQATKEVEEQAVARDTVEHTVNTASQLKDELTECRDRKKEIQSALIQQFTDLRKEAYRVQSIFIHRGTATAGHYWIYIYDFHDKKYRKYNDGYVTAVENEAEVLEGRDGATPYLLVFIREDLVDDIAEAVRRASVKKPEEVVDATT